MGGVIGQGFVKFVVSAGLIHCPVTVDLHRADAVLDPRAPTTMVSAAFAGHLRLTPHGTASATAYGFTADLPIAGPVTVGIHPATFRLATVAIETPEMEAHAPAGADFVLGADALAAMMLRIDVARHQLSSVSASDAARMIRRSTPAALQLDEAGHLLISIRIGHDAPLLAMLDLGSDVPVTMNRAFATAHGVDLSGSPNGSQPVDVANNDNGLDIAFDNNHFTPKTVQIADQSAIPLTLGAPVFEAHSIIVDLREKKIWIAN